MMPPKEKWKTKGTLSHDKKATESEKVRSSMAGLSLRAGDQGIYQANSGHSRLDPRLPS